MIFLGICVLQCSMVAVWFCADILHLINTVIYSQNTFFLQRYVRNPDYKCFRWLGIQQYASASSLHLVSLTDGYWSCFWSWSVGARISYWTREGDTQLYLSVCFNYQLNWKSSDWFSSHYVSMSCWCAVLGLRNMFHRFLNYFPSTSWVQCKWWYHSPSLSFSNDLQKWTCTLQKFIFDTQ